MTIPTHERAATHPIPAVAGIGLRAPHHRWVSDHRPAVAWLEAHAENYMAPAMTEVLESFADAYPISLHAVGLSLGSAHGLDLDHLDRLAALDARWDLGSSLRRAASVLAG